MPVTCVCGQVAEDGDDRCFLCGRPLPAASGPAATAPPSPDAAAPYVPGLAQRRPPPRSGPGALVGALVGLLVLAVVVVTVLLLGGRSQDATGSAASGGTTAATAPDPGDPTEADTTGAEPSEASDPSTVTQEPSSDPAYPDLVLPGRLCGRTGEGPQAAAVAGNDHTTCPFALNVGTAYRHSGAAGGTITLLVHSPVTEHSYAMRCSGDQPVTCTGGHDAVVYLFGGDAELTG